MGGRAVSMVTSDKSSYGPSSPEPVRMLVTSSAMRIGTNSPLAANTDIGRNSAQANTKMGVNTRAAVEPMPTSNFDNRWRKKTNAQSKLRKYGGENTVSGLRTFHSSLYSCK